MLASFTTCLLFQGIVIEEFVAEIDVVKLLNSFIKFSIDYYAWHPSIQKNIPRTLEKHLNLEQVIMDSDHLLTI